MSTPNKVAKTGFSKKKCLFSESGSVKCGENVSFMPLKDRFLFSLTKYYMKSGFEGKLTYRTCQNVDGIVSADIFYVFSESDHHYFCEMRSNFGFKTCKKNFCLPEIYLMFVDKTTENAPA